MIVLVFGGWEVFIWRDWKIVGLIFKGRDDIFDNIIDVNIFILVVVFEKFGIGGIFVLVFVVVIVELFWLFCVCMDRNLFKFM